MKLTQSATYRPTPRQREYANLLARQIRDIHPNSPSAHSLAKYYSIDDLKAAVAALRRGEEVVIE